MNVSQLTKSLGTSKPTLYKRVKNAGINLNDIRDAGTGELTPDGVRLIASLFDEKTPIPPQARKASTGGAGVFTPNPDDNPEILRTQRDAYQREVDLLRERVEAQNAEIQRLTADLEAWRAKAQEIDVRQLLLLTTSAVPRRRGVREWISGLFGHNGDREDPEQE